MARQSALAMRAAGLAVVLILAAGCHPAAPAAVSLADLVTRQTLYEDKLVKTEGRVRAFNDASGPYCVIEDALSNRVALLPREVAAPYASRMVRVAGTYGFDPGVGRFIRVTGIAPLPAVPTAP